MTGKNGDTESWRCGAGHGALRAIWASQRGAYIRQTDARIAGYAITEEGQPRELEDGGVARHLRCYSEYSRTSDAGDTSVRYHALQAVVKGLTYSNFQR